MKAKTLHKQPPHSTEAEQSVLGGLMLRNDALDEIVFLQSEDFYRADHQLIFTVIVELIGARKRADFVTVTERLRTQGRLDEAGGMAYLGTLAVDTYSIAGIRAYAGIVRENATLRKLIAVGSQIADLGYQPEGRNSRELVEQAEQSVFAIRHGRRDPQAPQAFTDFIAAAESEIESRYKSGGQLGGISTGFADLDRYTDGLHPGDLVFIAARPGMGKSALAANVAEYVALEGARRASLIFSMEMSGGQLALRSLSGYGRVNLSALRNGRLNDGDWERVAAAGGILRTDKIIVDESPALSPLELRARARRVARKQPLGLIVVDYIQLMQVPGTRENRTNEISEISRSLKSLAKELQVPVIALSQLSRGVEARESKRPRMSDLRDSGGLEQDADLILFIYRDEIYNPETRDKGVAEIIIGKQRQGQTGVTTHLQFHGEYCRFENLPQFMLDEIRNQAPDPAPPKRGFGRMHGPDAKMAAAGGS